MKILFLLLLVLPGLSFAASDCGMTLNLTNATVLSTGKQQVVQQGFTISRSVNNDNRCTGYRMFFGKGLANDYQRAAYSGANSYQYNLHSNINMTGILKDVNDALNSNEFLSGSTPSRNTNYSGSFYVSIPGNSTNNTPAGTYTDNVTVSFFRVSSNGNTNLEGTQTFTISITVATKINVSIVDEGGAYDVTATAKILDFGTLEQNEQMGADLIVDTNTPFQVKFSSANNGNLSNEVDTIQYQTSVNSAVVNLDSSASTPVTVVTKGSPATRERYNIQIKILSPTENKVSGQYTDTITITTIAN